MQEKYDLAIEMYKKANEIKTEDLEVVNMLAHLYYYKKMFEESISCLKIFLKQNPRDTENLILL
jgi:tetratricopeptide (TPR) repeat protein